MNSIDQVIEKFISHKEVDSAIMITGAWGCGKTHYWSNTVAPMIIDKELKPIYLSLYGVSTIAEIESNLFWHMAFPTVNPQTKKMIRGGAMIAKGMLGVLSKITVGGNVELDPNSVLNDLNIKAGAIGEMHKYVVCFDDLERCKVDIAEVLGFINHYVEHQGMKTLIIAHEAEVDKLSISSGEVELQGSVVKEFDRVKEKVIGRVLTYAPNLEEVCPQLFQIYEETDPKYFQFLQTKSDEIIRLFAGLRVDNFRSIRFILDNFREQYNVVAKKELIDNAFNKLFLFNTIIAIEYKKGFLSSKDLNDPHNLNDLYALNRMMSLKKAQKNIYNPQTQEEEVSPELKYIERIVNEYLKDPTDPLINRLQDYVYLPSVYQLILTGAMEIKQLDADLVSLLPENVPPHLAAFRRLFSPDFRSFSDKEFRGLAKEVWGYSKKGYYPIYDYSQIATFFLFFIKNGIVNETQDTLSKMIQSGIKNSMKLESTPIKNNHYLETLLHFKSEDEFVEEHVKPWIKNAHQQIKDKMVENDALEFLKLVKAADQEELAEFMSSRKVSPFLQRVSKRSLHQSFKELSNRSIDLLAAHVQERYGSGLRDYLTEELKTVQVMRDYFNKEAKRLGGKSLRKYVITELIKSLDSAIKNLKAASPKSV